MKDVFISHASNDRVTADRIRELLEARGLACWIAPRDIQPGKDYAEEIIRGIENASAVVLILSENANMSTFVKKEIERAVSKAKAVFPVRIREVFPSPGLELFISSSHWVDAWQSPMDAKIDQLANSIRPLVGQAVIPPSVKSKRFNLKLYGTVTGVVAVFIAVVALYLKQAPDREVKALAKPAVPTAATAEVVTVKPAAQRPVLAREDSIVAAPQPKLVALIDAGVEQPKAAAVSSVIAQTVKELPALPVIQSLPLPVNMMTLLKDATEFDRAGKIGKLVQGVNTPFETGMVVEMLKGTTGNARNQAIGHLLDVIKPRLDGNEAAAIAGHSTEYDRAALLKQLARKLRSDQTPQETVLLLQDTHSIARNQALSFIIDSIRPGLSGEQAAAILDSSSEYERSAGLKLIARKLRSEQSSHEAVLMLKDTTSIPRNQALGIIAETLKPGLNGQEAAAILATLGGYDRAEGTRLIADKLSMSLTAADVVQILKGMESIPRLKALHYLAAHLAPNISVENAVSIVDNITDYDRAEAIGLIASKLKPLTMITAAPLIENRTQGALDKTVLLLKLKR